MIGRSRITDVVLVLAATAGVLAVIATSGSVTTSELERRSDNLLPAYREDEITYIKIERGERVVALERGEVDDGGLADWFLRDPVNEEADVAAVQELLDSLEFASWLRRVDPGAVDRGRFGLETPRWTMRIRMGKIGYRLRLGAESPSPPGSAYLEVDGQGVPRAGVGIISKSLIQELEVDADTFREHLIMPYVSSALDRLLLEGLGGTRKLRRADWGGWRFDGMAGDRRVNRKALDRILLQFARTKADRFLEPEDCEKALRHGPSVRVTMTPAADRPLGKVEVGGRCPSSDADVVALRRSPDPLGACVPQSVMEGLATPEEDLVDANLFSMRKDEVEAFEVRRGDRKLELARKGTGFRMRHPREADVDETAGNQRLFELVSARGRILDGADPDETGLSKPVGKVVLRSVPDEDSKIRTEEVTFSRPDPRGRVYVRREQDGAVLAVSRAASRALAVDASIVRSRRILTFEKEQLREIDLRHGGVRQRLERHASGTFTLHEPKNAPYDAGLAADLVDRLATLGADRWVADEDDGSFGLAHPAVRVAVTLVAGDAGEKHHEISIGDLTSGGAYASLAGDPGVFVLPRSAYETLTALLLDRGVFVVEPTQVVRISLAGGGRTAVLERDGAGWSQTGGDAELSPGRVRAIVDALGTLRADGAIHLGPAKPEEGLARPTLIVDAERSPGNADASRPIRWKAGAGDSWRGVSVFYARREGIDATYALARSKVLAVVNAL